MGSVAPSALLPREDEGLADALLARLWADGQRPYDLDRGRINFRHKSEGAGPIGSGQRRPQFRRR